MQFEFYAGGDGDFFLRPPGAAAALHWVSRERCWSSEPASLPDGVLPIEFGQLPESLQEEMLAFLARSEALGNQYWGAQN